MAILTNQDQKSDAELVQLSLKNEDYFLYIIKRYEDKLSRYIRRISNIPHEDAEDVLQEVFIKVYYKLNDFDRDLKFSSWIYRIAHNQVVSNYRKLKIRPQRIDLDPNNDLIENLVADLDIETEVDQIYLRKKIFQILNQLDDKNKEILVLKFLEEKNYREISDILKKPMGTVGTLITKAKKQFKEELEKLKVNF